MPGTRISSSSAVVSSTVHPLLLYSNPSHELSPRSQRHPLSLLQGEVPHDQDWHENLPPAHPRGGGGREATGRGDSAGEAAEAEELNFGIIGTEGRDAGRGG